MVCPGSLVRTIKNSSYRDRERDQRRYNHHGYHGYHHYYCCCLNSFSTFHGNRESSHETFSSVFSWIQRYSQTTVATSAPSATTCTTTLGNSLLQLVQPVAALKLCSITALYIQQFYKYSSRSADLLTPPLYLSRLLYWPASEYARLSLEPRSNRTASSRYNGYRGLPLATRQSDSDVTGCRGFPGC